APGERAGRTTFSGLSPLDFSADQGGGLGNEFVCLIALGRQGSVSGTQQFEKNGRQDRILELGRRGPADLFPSFEGRCATGSQIDCGLFIEGKFSAQYLKRHAFL